MKLFALLASLVGGGLGVWSAILMTKGSAHTPWKMQTWDGSSEKEEAFRATTAAKLRLGLQALAAAFVFSAVSAMLGYLS